MISPIQFGPALEGMDPSYQHQWFLTDKSGVQLSAKACKALSGLDLKVKLGNLQVRASGMLMLELILDVIEDEDSFRLVATDLQKQPLAAINEGELAATWFEHIVGQPCLLLKRDPGHPDRA